jgi:hypothetical protein
MLPRFRPVVTFLSEIKILRSTTVRKVTNFSRILVFMVLPEFVGSGLKVQSGPDSLICPELTPPQSFSDNNS